MVIQNPMGFDSKKAIKNCRKFKKNPVLIKYNPIVKMLMYFLWLQPAFSFAYDELLGKTRSLLLSFCAIISTPVA